MKININYIQELNNPTMLHQQHCQYGARKSVQEDASASLTYCLPVISWSGTSQMCLNQRNLVSAIFASVTKTQSNCYFGALLSIKSAAIPTVGT